MKNIKHIVLIIILCVSAKSYAQFTPLWNVSYQHTAKPNFSNESRKMAQDAAGNVFVLADVTSDGITVGTTYHYVTLLKYSSSGAPLASKDLNITNHVVSGFDNFSAFGLEIDGTGNVYIGYCLYNTANNFNVKISKFDNSLNRIWTNNFGSTGVETGVDMKVTTTGTVYAIIKSVAGGSTYYKAIKSVNADAAALIVYISNANNDVYKSLAIDNSQNLYIAGYRTISGYKNVLLISVSGTTNALRFTSVYNGGVAGDDYANMVTVGIDGNIYVVGTSNQGGGHGADQLVLKHLSSATQFWVWTSLLQNSNSDEGLFISAPETNFLYTAMTTAKKVRVMRLNTSDGHISVSGAASNYEPLPTVSYSSISGITLKDMKISANKNIYCTGSVLATNLSAQAFSATYLVRFDFNATGGTLHVGFSQPVLGDFISNYGGTALAFNNTNTSVVWLRDRWSTNATHASEEVQLLGLDVPSTLRSEASEGNVNPDIENTVLLYPNPVKDIVMMDSKSDIQRVEIFDMIGNRVADINQIAADRMVNVSELKHGIYICRMNTSSGIVIKKLTIE